jgi:hypothetical protein
MNPQRKYCLPSAHHAPPTRLAASVQNRDILHQLYHTTRYMHAPSQRICAVSCLALLNAVRLLQTVSPFSRVTINSSPSHSLRRRDGGFVRGRGRRGLQGGQPTEELARGDTNRHPAARPKNRRVRRGAGAPLPGDFFPRVCVFSPLNVSWIVLCSDRRHWRMPFRLRQRR